MNSSTRLSLQSLLRMAALLVLLLSGHAAQAAFSCTASMTSLSFGTINPLASQTDATATLTYNCTKDDSGTDSALVCFHIGEPGGNAWNPRLMLSGSNTLQFQMYQDASRTKIWGSLGFGSPTPNSVEITLRGKGASNSGTVTLYGRVAGGQTGAIPGSYADNYQQYDTAISINASKGSTPPTTCNQDYQNSYFPFNVTATVDKNCSVTAGANLDLGTVPANATNISGSTSISVTCSNTTPYYIGLRPSNNNTAGAGTMKSAVSSNTSTVGYQLYQPTGGAIWGDTATSTSAGNGVAGSGNGTAKTYTVNATAPSADFQPDTYTDTVTVHVNY